MQKIELLSPAKNLQCALAAINCGADAVYIGANAFGARVAAGNSIADIENLANYAHKFRAKVYLTLNTILTDNELRDAEKLSWQAFEAGIDALIIQDFGLLMCDLPPLPLHASTQTDNRTAEKVKFLQQNGFSRVVLARELSLKQIADIKQNTNIELEVFVGGALCISYSGQCYISAAACGRSANRGECAQYCRLSYDLIDGKENKILKNKYLLSLKDLDLSENLPDLLTAGVKSLKIEGRLKSVDYVKNTTAFYRKKLDEIFEKNANFRAASSGKTRLFFTPNLEKTFHRSATNYFINERQSPMIQTNTPKSTGEYLGKITFISNNFFKINTQKILNNGDGLCFFTQNDELQGFRINKTENGKIFPQKMPDFSIGTQIFRNQDIAFEKILQGKSSERKITLEIIFKENAQNIEIQVIDEDNIKSSNIFSTEKQIAQKPKIAIQTIENQLNKLGDTIFELKNIKIIWEKPLFFPVSILAQWRRQIIENHLITREKNYIRKKPEISQNGKFYKNSLDYTGNVANTCAKEFYTQRGVTEIASAFELHRQTEVPLMFCKYCIKYEMGWCVRQKPASVPPEPYFLVRGNQRFRLKFDCEKCEMYVF